MKNRRLDIKVSDYEYNQLNQEAERRGMNKSELIRSLIAKFPEPKEMKDG